MGAKLENIIGYASSITDISWISYNMSDININVEDNLFVLPNAAFVRVQVRSIRLVSDNQIAVPSLNQRGARL